MSCSICLLPFVPAANSTNPRPPPQGILTPQQDVYLRTAYGVGRRLMCAIAKFDYLDQNLFGAKNMMFIQWESENGTFFMMHTTCANILRRVFGAEGASKKEGYLRISEIEEVLGRAQGGKNASRFRFVPYEDVGAPADRVDIMPFWKLGNGLGLNVFSWPDFAKSPAQWALAKPDVFPRFFSKMNPERLSCLGLPVSQPGILTRQPLDVLLLLLPHLSVPAFLALTSTCRLIRIHALTTFQPHARSLVLSLGWATPLLAIGEYNTAVTKNPSAAQSLAHSIRSPPTGDWMLYLSHVHRTSSMRARRRIWNICEAIRRTVEEQLPLSKYGQNIEVERAKLETNMTLMSQAMDNLRDMKGKDGKSRGNAPNSTSSGMGDFPFPMNMPNYGL